MEASLHTPLALWFSTSTAVSVSAATSQFCQEPYTSASERPWAATDSAVLPVPPAI